MAVLQANAAAGLAVRERHGDGGVGVLAQAAGLSKRDAAGQVKTVERLQEMPSARDALESGEISVANAKTLATACERTSAEQVEQDGELLATGCGVVAGAVRSRGGKVGGAPSGRRWRRAVPASAGPLAVELLGRR